MTAEQVKQLSPDSFADIDLAITSYGSLLRMPVLARDRLAVRHPRRGAGDQEPRRQADPGGQGAEGQGAHRADRHPGRKSPGRLWSIFDFINPGLLGTAKQFGSYAKRLADRPHNPYGPLRELVRPYILRRMKTDKSGHRRPAGQDRGEGALPAQPQAGGALSAGGRGSGRGPEGADGHPAQGDRAGDADAAQADLQSPVAMAGRRRLGGGRQRQVGAPARDRRGGGRAPGEDAGLHPVPRDDGAAGGVPGRHLRPPRPGAARRARR